MSHARRTGVIETPEIVGYDDAGEHEVLRWIAGDEIDGVDLGDDDRMREVGALVRRVRDSLASFAPPADAVWRLRPAGAAFVHGDLSPWNTVVRDGSIVGVLDWDQCGPGRPLEDLAYAAWVWVPLEAPDNIPAHWIVPARSLEGQKRRLRLLVDAFGLSAAERAGFISEIAYVMATAVGRVALGAMSGDDGMNNIWWDGQRVGTFGAAMTWLTDNWDEFQAALTTPQPTKGFA